MPDVLDEIINRLPSSTLKKLLDSTSECAVDSTNLSNTLNQVQQIKIKQINKEYKRKILDLQTRTNENRNYLTKVKKDLEDMKSPQKSETNQQHVKAYSKKITELENQIKYLTKDFGMIDLEKLFIDVENLNTQLQEYKTKIAEAKAKYQCFEGFPPNKDQAQIVISKLKERIKKSETQIDTRY